MEFCQLTEFFMNAFKFGQTISCASSPHVFTAEPYLADITGVFPQVFPCRFSHVLYPSSYQEIYAVDSPFFKKLLSIFSVVGQFDPSSQITTVVVQEREI